MAGTSVIERFLRAIETATVPGCDVWSAGATLDATVPDWRLHAAAADAIRAGRTVVLDWEQPGRGAPLSDLAWYLAINCRRLPQSKEASIAAHREALQAARGSPGAQAAGPRWPPGRARAGAARCGGFRFRSRNPPSRLERCEQPADQAQGTAKAPGGLLAGPGLAPELPGQALVLGGRQHVAPPLAGEPAGDLGVHVHGLLLSGQPVVLACGLAPPEVPVRAARRVIHSAREQGPATSAGIRIRACEN